MQKNMSAALRRAGGAHSVRRSPSLSYGFL